MSHSVSGSLTSQSGTVGEFIISPKWKGVIKSRVLGMVKGGQTDTLQSSSR